MVVKLVACAALLTACTHHRTLPQAFTDVEVGRWVTIRTTTGATLSAITVQTMGGVGYQEEGAGMIDPSTIASVADDRSLRAAGEGFLIGAGAGIVGGAIAGFADGDDPPCDEWCFFNMTAGQKAVLLGVVFGSLGGLIGIAAGVVHGSEDVYEDSTGVAITPGGPPGSVAGMTVTF